MCIFAENVHLPEVRATSYALLAEMLPFLGALSKDDAKSMNELIQISCQDIIGQSESSNGSMNFSSKIKGTPSQHVGSIQTDSSSGRVDTASTCRAQVTKTANTLLTALLQYVTVPRSTRHILERTAIISNNSDALLAATLNLATGASHETPSLLPFALNSIAVEQPAGTLPLSFEALVRPRMPVIRTPAVSLATDSSDGDDENLGVDANSFEESTHGESLMEMEIDLSPRQALDEKAKEQGGNSQNTWVRLETFTSKRRFEGVGTENPITSHPGFTGPKRQRYESQELEVNAAQNSTQPEPMMTGALPSNAGALSPPQPTRQDLSSEDDDDSSDFEIPKLVHNPITIDDD